MCLIGVLMLFWTWKWESYDVLVTDVRREVRLTGHAFILYYDAMGETETFFLSNQIGFLLSPQMHTDTDLI